MKIPKRVVFQAWCKAGRLQNRKIHGEGFRFSVDAARKQYRRGNLDAPAMVFAEEIIKWHESKKKKTKKRR